MIRLFTSKTRLRIISQSHTECLWQRRNTTMTCLTVAAAKWKHTAPNTWSTKIITKLFFINENQKYSRINSMSSTLSKMLHRLLRQYHWWFGCGLCVPTGQPLYRSFLLFHTGCTEIYVTQTIQPIYAYSTVLFRDCWSTLYWIRILSPLSHLCPIFDWFRFDLILLSFILQEAENKKNCSPTIVTTTTLQNNRPTLMWRRMENMMRFATTLTKPYRPAKKLN